MPRLLVMLLAVLFAMAVSTMSAETAVPSEAQAAHSSLDPFGFAEEQYGSFGIVDAPYPYSGRHGCYPVGNGMVFGHLGVAEDFTLLRGMTGPGYQTRDGTGKWEVWQKGNWPDIPLKFKATAPKGPHWPVYHLGDKWTRQSIQVRRGAAMVRTVQTANFGSLYCLTYAVPGEPVIIREYAFVPGEKSDPDWEYYLELEQPPAMNNDCECKLQDSRRYDEDRTVIFDIPVECIQGDSGMYFQGWMPDFYAGRTLPQEAGQHIGGRLIDPVSNAGATWRTEVAIVVTEIVRPEETEQDLFDIMLGAVKEPYKRYVYPTDPARLREQTYIYWQEFTAQNLKPDWLGEQGVEPGDDPAR